MSVIYSQKAADSLAAIAEYIAANGSIETAWNYYLKLKEYGESLGLFPEKYPFCRHKSYKKKNLRCAYFDKNYAFIYSVSDKNILIYDVVHCKRLK